MMRILNSAILLAAVLSAATAEVLVAQAEDPLSGNLTVEVDGPLLADFPIHLRLTVENLGERPLMYWCGGPGNYPSAELYRARLTDARGNVTTIKLHNGQFREGSGVNRPVKRFQVIPAVLGPLAPGKYTLRVEGEAVGYLRDGRFIETWPAMISMSVFLEVKRDPAAVTAAERELMDRARGDPLAKHVAQSYGIDPAVQQWLDQLLDDDPSVAFKVVGHLQHVRRLPDGGERILKRAAIKHCRGDRGPPDKNLLRYISLIARRFRSDESLDAVLTIASADVDSYARQMAIADLADIPSPRAEKALLKFAEDARSPYYWSAIAGLANRGNAQALPPLLAEVKSENPERRCYILHLLSNLREVPEALTAIKNAQQDPSKLVRERAAQLLNRSSTD